MMNPVNSKAANFLSPWINWRRKRFWLLVLLLAWTLFGFLAAPRILHSTLVDLVEGTGRVVQVGDIRLNPFALTLEVDELEVRDADQTAIVRFDSLRINFQLSSLFRRAWTFDEIRFDGLHIEEERYAAGDTRLLRLASDFKPEENAAAVPDTHSDPPRIIVHEFTLNEGGIGLTDHLAGGFNGTLGPVSAHLSDMRTIRNHAGAKRVTIETPEGGVISWSGDLQLVPLESSGHLSVRGKGLPLTLRYLDHYLPVNIKGEEIEVNFDYRLFSDGDELRVAIDKVVSRSGDIHVYLPDEDTPFLSVPEIEITGGSLRWPNRDIRAGTLAIRGAALTVVQQSDGGFNLNRMAATDGGETTATLPEPWTISVDQLDLDGARVDFEDRSFDPPGLIRAQNVMVAFTGVDNLNDTVMPGSLSLELAQGGNLSWNGTAQLLPVLKTDGSVRISGLSLVQAQPWLQAIARLELESGLADLEGSLSVSQESGAPPELTFSGKMALRNFELQDALRQRRLAAVEGLRIERFEYNHAARSLKTSALAVDKPYGRIHIHEDKSTNLTDLVIAEGETEAQGDSAASPEPVSISIAGIEVADAALDFADDSLPLPFNTSIRAMNGEFSTLSSHSTERSEVNLEGRVNEFGDARIEGALNAWDFTASSDIRMVFRNLEMARLSPYTIQFAGYAIDSGRLDVDLSYKLNDRKLESENHIVIRELQLGDKVDHPEAASLPLKLGVALLKDSEGVIDVDLPVSGDLDDPEFRIGGIVWKAIGNLLTRIVSSPFRFLGRLVGIDSEDFGTLAFQPGSASLSPPDEEQLIKLAGAMQQRPELSVVVNGVSAAGLDRPALQEMAFEAQFESLRTELLAAAGEDVLDVDRQTLEQLFANAFSDEDLQTVKKSYEPAAPNDASSSSQEATQAFDEAAYLATLRQRFIEAQPVADGALDELAQARAATVVSYLRTNTGGGELKVSQGEIVELEGIESGPVPLELEVEAGNP